MSERHKEDEYPAAVPLSSVLRYYSESDQKSDESCVLNDDFSDIDEFVTDEMLSELSSLPCDDLSLLDSPSKTPPQSLPVSSTGRFVIKYVYSGNMCLFCIDTFCVDAAWFLSITYLK